jgi:uncharacterized protein YkwD
MSQIPASNVLRGAGWCLALLLLASLGGVSPSAAEPEPVASSMYEGPTAVLPQLHLPDPMPTPTAEPEPTPTLTPITMPSPTAVPAPPPAPQPVSEPAAPPAPPPSPQPPPQRYADGTAAAAIVALANELRAQHGLPPLAVSGPLAAAAQAYAQTIATNDWLAHDGPDGSTLSSRAQAAGYTGWFYLAENLYQGFFGESPANIIQAWAASPAHLSAMLSDAATEMGVGCYVSGDYRWCVQDFGAR